MFEKIELETKLKSYNNDDDRQTDSVVSESIERSLFGYFSLNYNRYKNDKLHANPNFIEIWMNIFSQTKILKQDVYRSLLYFNLPYESIIA